MQGTVKRIVRDRGFGFIKGEDGREIFFLRSGLEAVDFETLKEGEAVQFEVERREKGPRAVSVRPNNSQ